MRGDTRGSANQSERSRNTRRARVGNASILGSIILFLALTAPLVSAASTKRSLSFSDNETYSVYGQSFIIKPFNVNGTGYLIDGNLRLWAKGDCKSYGPFITCLASATDTKATFDETFRGAILTAKHELSSADTLIGDTVFGAVTLTNTNTLGASDIDGTLTVTGPATFGGGSTTQHISGSIDTERVISYGIITSEIGTVAVNGSLAYFDGNRTRELELGSRSFPVKIPFTYALGFDNMTTNSRTNLSFNISKRTDNNLSFDIKIMMPPQTIINATGLRTQVDGTLLRRTVTLTNETTANISATYWLGSTPSAPINLTIKYSVNDHSPYTITRLYSFYKPDLGVPTIAASAKPTTVGKQSEIHVIILTNTTGELRLRSDLFATTVSATGGTYDYLTNVPQKSGNFTLAVAYVWLDRFGTEYRVEGNTTIVVGEGNANGEPDTSTAMNMTPFPLADAGNTTDAARNATNASDGASPTITLDTTPPQEDDVLIWIIGGVAVGCMLALYAVLMRMRSPISRIESLLRRTGQLRRALLEKRGGATKEELAQLAELEAELDELQSGMR